ncbi:MAG TPA: septum formation initiator family protein [Acidimicrobiia bacterium]|jgi:cell division protein FtsB|nr:septum formation initiator family protein [Acidimicrobiia bacterium]
MTHWGRARVALIALGVATFLFLFVFPTRSYLDQRGRVGAAQHDVNVLREQNDKLQAEALQLQTPAAIERMAREQFHMVKPGEQVYNVSPAPTTTSTTTPAP